MADKEELHTQLETYRVQLQQVDAALASNPDDPDLRKLRDDLCEVINLTKSLLGGAGGAGSGGGSRGASAEDSGGGGGVGQGLLTGLGGSGTTGSSASGGRTSTGSASGARWQVGDRVMAPWSEDGNYYDATVLAINKGKGGVAAGDDDDDEDHDDERFVKVKFDDYGVQDAVPYSDLRPRGSGPAGKGGKRAHMVAQKEYKKQKALKKKERLKEIEHQREADKKSWQSFNAKALHKKKGVTKKSIFATPESVAGRVGIGTCGVADRPMTEYHQIEKHQVVKKTSLQHPCNLPGPAGLN